MIAIVIVRTNGSQLLFSLLLSLALIAGKSYYYNTLHFPERVEMEAADWLAGGERPASQL